MSTNNHLVQRCRLATTAEPVWLSSLTHEMPLISHMCTVWRRAWCFLAHGTLRRPISCEMCWNLWRRNWISVHHDGFCSVLFNYTVWLAQKVSKKNQDLRMSSQVISETCGIAMYKGGGRLQSVLRPRETLVLDEEPPVTLSILRMVDKAFHVVINGFNPAFQKAIWRSRKGV